MKRFKLLGFAVAILVVVTLACGGGDEPAPTQPPPPTDAPPPPPTSESPPPPPPQTGALDFSLDPNSGSMELDAGFVPDPFNVALISGGDVDVAALNLGSGCTGYASSAPDFRIFWSGASSGLRVFFVPDEEGADATLIINGPSGNWSCNDDYSGWNPLVEFGDPFDGQYDIWVGSYSASDFIAGTLYVTELGLGPDDYTGGEAEVGTSVSQWASGATASSQYSDPGWSAMQATGAPDTEACGDYTTAWASATSTGVDWLELTYTTPVVPTQINIHETNSPGFVVMVDVIDESGGYYTVWEGDPAAADDCPRIFSIDVEGIDFPIVGVLVNLDQTNGSWNEIDAVELVGIAP